MIKVGCCVMLELFWKKLLIIKVIMNSDCFSKNTSLKSALILLNRKQLDFPVFVWIIYHEQQSIFIATKESFYLESRSGE